MPNVNLSNLNFPIIQCTSNDYNIITVKKTNVLYVITDAINGSPSIYFNNRAISSITDIGESVLSVNNITADDVGNVELDANDLDTYNKKEIDDAIGNVLNIQYLKAPSMH